MSKFSLIKQLKEQPNVEQSVLPEGIEYQEYDVSTKDGVMNVFIPLREAGAFEQSLSEQTVLFRSDVRRLLRTHRGIIG